MGDPIAIYKMHHKKKKVDIWSQLDMIEAAPDKHPELLKKLVKELKESFPNSWKESLKKYCPNTYRAVEDENHRT